MSRILSLLLALSWPLPLVAPPSPPARDSDLEAGINLLQGGEFDAAIPVIEKALTRLDAQPRRARERAEAHFYLGIAHLELESPAIARGHFLQAARIDPSFQPDPAEFSRQVLREFEAARAPAATEPSAAGPPPRRRSRLIVAAVAGGAALAGTAVAVAGGGSQGTATTPTMPTADGSPTTTAPSTTLPTAETTTTTTMPRPTTTTTTTIPPAPEPPPPPPPPPPTNPPPCQRCQNDGSSPGFGSPGNGATVSGTITVRCAPPECKANCPSFEMWYGWCPAGACSSEPDAASSIGSSGSAPYSVSWNSSSALPNRQVTLLCVARSGGSPISRTATIEVNIGSPFKSAPLTWISDLDVPDGQGQLILDGTTFHTQGRGRTPLAQPARGPETRVEAVLIDASGRPGTWRFDLGGSFEPGTLRVIAGDVDLVTAHTVVFRLRGKAGERVVFAFRTNR